LYEFFLFFMKKSVILYTEEEKIKKIIFAVLSLFATLSLFTACGNPIMKKLLEPKEVSEHPFPEPGFFVTVDIEGTPKVGETLTAKTVLYGTGTISGYQWARSNDTGTFFIISDANSPTYTLTMDDLDKYIEVIVTLNGNSGSVISDTVGPVQDGDGSP